MMIVRKIVAVIGILTINLSSLIVPVTYAAASDSPNTPVSNTQQPINQLLPSNTPIKVLASSAFNLTEQQQTASTYHTRTPLRVQKLAKKVYSADEAISVTILNPDQEHFKTEILDSQGKPADIALQQSTQGGLTNIQIENSNQFIPGEYSLTVTDQDGISTKQDFTWGVLALNPDKGVYKPQENAFLSMAVLDDQGEMVCDAKAILDITKPDGTVDTLSTDNGKLVANQSCHSKHYTISPDYEAHYQLGDAGDYTMKLTATTKNGTYSISDVVKVADDTPFIIKRTSATRLYPPLTYPMDIQITANKDFDGVVTETVPESFAITPAKDQTSYNTVKTMYLGDNDPAKSVQQSVLGASDSKLQSPFDGSYAITQGFGVQMTDHGLVNFYSQYGLSGHDGVDFGLPLGTPLYAVDAGKVLLAGPGDYGTTIVLQHSWGRTYYGHLSKLNVVTGDTVAKGSLLGYSGNTGESTGPHLHFGMKPNNPDVNNGYGGKIDPLPYLPIGGGNILSQALPMLGSDVLGASTSAETVNSSPTITPTPPLPVETASSSATIQSATAASQIATNSASQTLTVLDQQIANEVSTDASVKQKVKVLQWRVTMKKGQTQTLSYQYKAPHISPQFYLMGPVRFFAKEKKDMVYQEPRSWQLAADSVATTVTYMAAGTDETKDVAVQVDSTQTSGNVSSSTTQVHSGQRSYDFFTTGTPAAAFVHTYACNAPGNPSTCVVQDAGTRISFWIYMPSYPSTSDGDILQVYNAADSAQVFSGFTMIAASHKLQIGGGSGPIGNAVIPTGQWVHLTLSFVNTGGTTYSIKSYVNGTLDASTSLSFSISGTGSLRYGLIDATPYTASQHMYLDDMYIDNGSNLDDPGNIRVAHKRPFSNGTSNPWTVNGSAGTYGANNARYVNEQPHNNTDFVSTTTTSSSENYDVEAPNVGDQDISRSPIIGYLAWVFAISSIASPGCTGQITANGSSSNITLTSAGNVWYGKGVYTNVYPSSSAKVGMVSCSSASTTKMFEAGLDIAYIQPTLSALMRHGKYFDQSAPSLGEQPFTF